MEDPVLDWLDRLDEHWQEKSQSPPWKQWLEQARTQEPLVDNATAYDELVSELLRADLDWRLRQHDKTQATGLVTAELLQLEQVRNNKKLQHQLLDDEFVFRCQSNEAETIGRFASLVANVTSQDQSSDQWEEHFLNTAIKRKPVEVKLFGPTLERDGPILKCNLNTELEIGRAHENEPPAPAILVGKPRRMIVAHAREVSISRNQVLLRRAEWAAVKVKNISAKVPIVIGDSKQLQPQRQLVAPVPCILSIGKLRIRLE